MSNMKHAPGPWALNESVYGDNFMAVSAPNHGELATVVIRMSEPSWGERQKTEELEANARLIAAAPELLGALEMAVKHYEEWASARQPHDLDEASLPWLAPARAAIAKARGEA